MDPDVQRVSSNQTGVSAIQTITPAIYYLAQAVAAAFPPPLSSSTTWDPANLASGASETKTVTCAGAALGNLATCSFSLDLQGMSLTAYVSAADTVTCVLSNLTGGSINLASGTLKVEVNQK